MRRHDPAVAKAEGDMLPACRRRIRVRSPFFSLLRCTLTGWAQDRRMHRSVQRSLQRRTWAMYGADPDIIEAGHGHHVHDRQLEWACLRVESQLAQFTNGVFLRGSQPRHMLASDSDSDFGYVVLICRSYTGARSARRIGGVEYSVRSQGDV